MKSIIAELYDGNLEPYAKSTVRGSEYGKISDVSYKTYESLMEKLNDEEKVMQDSLLDMQGDMQAISNRESFIRDRKKPARVARFCRRQKS